MCVVVGGGVQGMASQLRTLFQLDQLPPLLVLLMLTVLREFTG